MKPLWRWIGLAALAMLLLQLFFVVRIAAMVVIDPQSSAFQRSDESLTSKRVRTLN